MATRFRRGEAVTFVSRGGRRFSATIADGKISAGKVAVLLSGDPFPVRVKVAQVHRDGADESKPSSRVPEMRTLAKEARLSGIEGYETMTAAELRQAIREANTKEDAPVSTKTKSKKAKSKTKPSSEAAKSKPKSSKAKPASKAKPTTSKTKTKTATKPSSKSKTSTKAKTTTKSKATKPAASKKSTTARKPATKKAPAKTKTTAKAKSSAPTGPNPFREKSNLHLMTEELMKGGKLQTVVNRLKKKMEIRPWSKDEVEDVDKAITKRVHLAAAALEKDHGFKIVKEGRGPQSTIQAIPPKKGGRRK